ncbi:hypothetical protein Tco_0623940 [Tanacetum coccineum]|uniref:Uncharacterized protein n=1 Tax=Tanacetum coccineum TaxID=301880 RepID=A0ABQ4WCM3_9ASTR
MVTASRVNRDTVSMFCENEIFVFDEKFPALDFIRLCGLMGGLRPLLVPRLAYKGGQLGSTSIGVPKVFSTSSGQMQTTEEEIDTSKALDASLVNTESSGTDLESMIQAAFRNMYDADGFNNQTRQQHCGQPEFNKEGEVDHNAEQCHDKHPLPATLTNNQITDLSYQSLESENICLKKTIA